MKLEGKYSPRPLALGTGAGPAAAGRARALALRAAGQAVACGHAPPCASL